MSEIKESEDRQKIIKKQKEQYSSEDVLATILAILEDKHGEDIFCLEVTKNTTLTDYIVITHGTSSTQQKVLAETCRKACHKLKYEHLNPLEVRDNEWSVLDYGSVIVHVFNPESRLRYNLEQIWEKSIVIDHLEFIKENPCASLS
ncbi:MAG: ribosome silencing factor [Candidatus Cloacimonadota bacterium]|nr:MAG: ribosome silencing factor [Candidatus Cloacimonadota bacterium]